MHLSSWGYSKENGPLTWHKTCSIAAAGKRQSPIDFMDNEVKHEARLIHKALHVSYPVFRDRSATLLNTGQSVQFHSDHGNNLSELSGGPLSKKYKFEQFHFHWGSKDSEGSEHRVNGKMYPAELHLVHWNYESFHSFKDAVSSGQPNALCVLGLFLKIGAESESLKPVTDLLARVKYAGSLVSFPGKFDLKAVLPSALKNYYTYDGSLTTPPLAECVKWIVFKEPLQVSAAQMDAFRALENEQGESMSGNYRPPCPLHSRTVNTSFK